LVGWVVVWIADEQRLSPFMTVLARALGSVSRVCGGFGQLLRDGTVTRTIRTSQSQAIALLDTLEVG
jgi:hypothetical protein